MVLMRGFVTVRHGQPQDRSNGAHHRINSLIGLERAGHTQVIAEPRGSVVSCCRILCKRTSTFVRFPVRTSTRIFSSKMLFATRHIVRSSLSLRTIARQPATLNARLAGMGPSMIRTLISKSLHWVVPAARGGVIGGGVHSAPLIISASTAKKYTEDHEAVVFDDSTGVGVVSITDYAQSSLGDVVFVELPALKTGVTKGG